MEHDPGDLSASFTRKGVAINNEQSTTNLSVQQRENHKESEVR